jgi:hypothetical protein
MANFTIPLPLSSVPLNQERKKKKTNSRLANKKFQNLKRSYGIRAYKAQIRENSKDK